MRVLVTGAAGFVGSAVVARLAGVHAIRAADIGAFEPPATVESRTGDLSDWDFTQDVVADMDAIVHLATGAARDGATPPSVMADSVGTTVALLEAARASGCRRMVLMSSSAVVTGYPRGTHIEAATEPAFEGIYALSKYLQEVVATRYAAEAGFEIPILRPWSVVDGHQRIFRDGRSIDSVADPLAHDGVFGWIDRGDLADACAAALVVPISGAPIIHLMANQLGRQLFNMSAANELLDWQPRFHFSADIPAGTRLPPRPSDVEGAV